ncbi:MAG: hypothetical protein LQ340_001372, partial [Diploschistes diacapsis]
TKRIHLATRLTPPLNRLHKTRTEIAPPQSTPHLRDARDAHLAARRRAANEVLARQRKDDARLAKERREGKEREKREWEELYGPGRVEEQGVGSREGWDEDGFM